MAQYGLVELNSGEGRELIPSAGAFCHKPYSYAAAARIVDVLAQLEKCSSSWDWKHDLVFHFKPLILVFIYT